MDHKAKSWKQPLSPDSTSQAATKQRLSFLCPTLLQQHCNTVKINFNSPLQLDYLKWTAGDLVNGNQYNDESAGKMYKIKTVAMFLYYVELVSSQLTSHYIDFMICIFEARSDFFALKDIWGTCFHFRKSCPHNKYKISPRYDDVVGVM